MKRLVLSLTLFMSMVFVVGVNAESTERVTPKPAQTLETSADILRKIQDEQSLFIVCPEHDLIVCRQHALLQFEICLSSATTAHAISFCNIRYEFTINICLAGCAF